MARSWGSSITAHRHTPPPPLSREGRREVRLSHTLRKHSLRNNNKTHKYTVPGGTSGSRIAAHRHTPPPPLSNEGGREARRSHTLRSIQCRTLWLCQATHTPIVWKGRPSLGVGVKPANRHMRSKAPRAARNTQEASIRTDNASSSKRSPRAQKQPLLLLLGGEGGTMALREWRGGPAVRPQTCGRVRGCTRGRWRRTWACCPTCGYEA